jgi:ubiquinone/menaquinone biosynthesis C-methylase UbiE
VTGLPIVPVEDVERWNDALARKYDIDDYYVRSGFLIRWIERRRLRCIQDLIAATRNDRILEVGCGGGHVLRLFPGADLTGVDVSGEMLRKARHNLAGYRVRLLKGELKELDLPEGGFDKIICSEVLEHTVDPESMLRQMRRLLRPGGRVVITLPNDGLIRRLKKLVRCSGLSVFPSLHRISWGGEECHLHAWRRREMREMLSRHLNISRERFAPVSLLPIRCCFLCTVYP